MKSPKYIALAAGLCFQCVGNAGFVDSITNVEWRQLTDSYSLEWTQVSNVCSLTTGVCNGAIGGVDMSGWTWANGLAVAKLFNDLGASFELGSISSAQSAHFTGSAAMGYSVFITGVAGQSQGAFFATSHSAGGGGQPPRWGIRGWTRDQEAIFGSTRARADFAESFVTSFDVNEPYPPSASSSIGVWLYRSVTSVPEPSAYWSLLVGLGAVLFHWKYRTGIFNRSNHLSMQRRLVTSDA